MYSAKDLEQGLRNIGIAEGDVVFVHSSYKALGELEGGAKTFFEVFLRILGDNGTLILPAFTFSTVTKDNPYFHSVDSKSVVGYLSEYFRTEVDGVRRSEHITHSCCAIGKYADYLLDGHEKDETMVGENSPLRKLPSLNGKLLFLGSGTNCNSSMHGVEQTVLPPYLFYNAQPTEYVFDDGQNRKIKKLKRFTFGPTGTKQRYFRLTDLLDETELRTGEICDAPSFLMSSNAVWRKGEQTMRKNPFFFVDSLLEERTTPRTTVREFKKNALRVGIYEDCNKMSESAVKDIKEKILALITERSEVKLRFMAENHENRLMEMLRGDEDIPWDKIKLCSTDAEPGDISIMEITGEESLYASIRQTAVSSMLHSLYVFCVAYGSTSAKRVWKMIYDKTDSPCTLAFLREKENVKLYLDNESSRLL